MHELGLCDAIVEAIRARAKGRPVAWARVRVGGSHAVAPEVIAQGVAVAGGGTEVEGADLELVVDPMRSRCKSCGAEAPVDDALSLVACRRCGGLDVSIEGSDHAVLEAVGYRGPDVRTTRRSRTSGRSGSGGQPRVMGAMEPSTAREETT